MVLSSEMIKVMTWLLKLSIIKNNNMWSIVLYTIHLTEEIALVIKTNYFNAVQDIGRKHLVN